MDLARSDSATLPARAQRKLELRKASVLTIDNSSEEKGAEDIPTGARQQFEKVAGQSHLPQPRRRDSDVLFGQAAPPGFYIGLLDRKMPSPHHSMKP